MVGANDGQALRRSTDGAGPESTRGRTEGRRTTSTRRYGLRTRGGRLAHEPRPLLVYNMQKYAPMAEGLHHESSHTFRPAYRIIIGLPFLPQAGGFCAW